MRFRNNNGTSIRKLICRSLQVNKQRNIFATLGIMLTSLLLSGVIVIGTSLMESIRLSSVGKMMAGGGIQTEIMIPVVGFILLIIVSGYLLIYNIFYIAIIKDIRFYGMLKTIGTTKKQIKKIILVQGMLLSVIGIPLGLFGGYGLGKLLMPPMMSLSGLNASYYVVVSDYRIFLVATLFALLTVFLSCRKPAKMASKVSPIEALRYTGTKTSHKKGTKNSKKGMKMHRMAYTNIFRSRKRGILVLASMSTSIILFLLMVTFLQSFSLEAFIHNRIQGEYVVAHEDYFNDEVLTSEVVTEDIYKALKENPDIASINPVYFHNTLTGHMDSKRLQTVVNTAKANGAAKWRIDLLSTIEEAKVQLYGFAESSLELVKEHKLEEGNMDMKELATGNYVLIKQSYPFYAVGDNIQIKVEEDAYKSFEIMAVVNHFAATDIGYTDPSTIKAYLPQEVYKEVVADGGLLQLQVNPREGFGQEVETYLDELLDQTVYSYKSKQEAVGEFESFVLMVRTVGLLLSGTIGVIALLNLFNTMLTSIIVRKQEFAMLESVGMTKRQLLKMLICEGAWYSVLTMLVVTVVGLPFIKGAVEVFGRETFFVFYNGNMMPAVLTYGVMMFVCILISCVSYGVVGKGSITERLLATQG